ncbi:basic proline-rich protein-like [Struthio camelus]|uniref:basic proline-rich protein-like n=1 Tax=Struthio camelus TaxID=8801 RepID=UPI003603D652
MARLSVREHLEGILSDFEALKKSFEVEDAAETPRSPPRSPGGAVRAPVAASPAPRSRLGSSLSFNRGTAGPGLKKVSSHGSVFPAEAERPGRLAAATARGSLPALDLHIAEEPGAPAGPPGTRGPPSPPGTAAREPSSSSSSPAGQQPPRLPKFPASLEGSPEGWDRAPEAAGRALPGTPLRLGPGASPARQPPRPPRHDEPAPAAPSPPPPAPRAAPFKLVSQPQTVQVSSQPAFLGGLVLVPAAPREPAPRRPKPPGARPPPADGPSSETPRGPAPQHGSRDAGAH